MKNILIAFSFLCVACGAFADYTDPSPFADYTTGMASDPAKPMAVEWQDANRGILAAALADDVIAGTVADEKAAKALLKKVRGGFMTDPLAASQIAAATQYVMVNADRAWWQFWRESRDAARRTWTAALLSAAAAAKSDDVKEYCLDQLRWCAYPEQAPAVAAIGERSGSKAVRDFCKIVTDELGGVGN